MGMAPDPSNSNNLEELALKGLSRLVVYDKVFDFSNASCMLVVAKNSSVYFESFDHSQHARNDLVV